MTTLTASPAAPSEEQLAAPAVSSPLSARILLAMAFRLRHAGNPELHADVSKTFPAEAVEAIRTHAYAAPVQADYNWGATLSGRCTCPSPWTDAPHSTATSASHAPSPPGTAHRAGPRTGPRTRSSPFAGVVIGPVQAVLTQLLRTDPHFQLVYEDKLAAVFIPGK